MTRKVLLPFTAVLLLLGLSSGHVVADEKVPPAIIRITEKHIDFLAGKALVARYHKGSSVAKPYFWPVNAPNGTPITRGWPMTKAAAGERKDHVHQKSAWFCHGDVIPEGMELKDRIKGVKGVDFWSEHKGHGRIVVTKVGKARQQKSHASITTTNEWQTASGEKILDETRTIHLYNLGESQLLVMEIDLHASVASITFGDTKEGSMGVRVRDSVTEKKGGKLENAEGTVGAANMWGRHSAWCDYSGKIPQGTGTDRTVIAGITVFDDPENTPKAAWHSRNYGLMAANPFARGRSGFPAMKGRTDTHKLPKGEHLKLRYGIYLHMGDAKEGKVAEAFEQFKKVK